MRSMPAGRSEPSAEHGPPPVRSAKVNALGVAPSDVELVERARSGDRWAQEAIFRRYVGIVGRLARRLLGDRDDADDVVQETFTTALRSLDSVTDASGLRRWLLAITVRRVRRAHRKRKLLRMLGLERSSASLGLAQSAAPDVSPEVRADLSRIDAMLHRLPTEERLAWMLRHVEGETLEEV